VVTSSRRWPIAAGIAIGLAVGVVILAYPRPESAAGQIMAIESDGSMAAEVGDDWQASAAARQATLGPWPRPPAPAAWMDGSGLLAIPQTEWPARISAVGDSWWWDFATASWFLDSHGRTREAAQPALPGLIALCGDAHMPATFRSAMVRALLDLDAARRISLPDEPDLRLRLLGLRHGLMLRHDYVRSLDLLGSAIRDLQPRPDANEATRRLRAAGWDVETFEVEAVIAGTAPTS
jgi:hypothetical protein